MDLCIKTGILQEEVVRKKFSFNPCFNGSMYKNLREYYSDRIFDRSFNPCFNGSMYKNTVNEKVSEKPEPFQSLF